MDAHLPVTICKFLSMCYRKLTWGTLPRDTQIGSSLHPAVELVPQTWQLLWIDDISWSPWAWQRFQLRCVWVAVATIAFHFILYGMWSRSNKVLQASGNSRWLSVRYCSYSRVVLVIQKHRGTLFVPIDSLRECLCKSGPVDFPWDTDLAHFSCVVRHSCTYTKTTIRLIGSLYFSEFYGN